MTLQASSQHVLLNTSHRPPMQMLKGSFAVWSCSIHALKRPLSLASVPCIPQDKLDNAGFRLQQNHQKHTWKVGGRCRAGSGHLPELELATSHKLHSIIPAEGMLPVWVLRDLRVLRALHGNVAGLTVPRRAAVLVPEGEGAGALQLIGGNHN